MNPQSGETTERSRYSKSIMSYKNQTENEPYGTSQPEIQERSSDPEIASDVKDSDEYGSSDLTLEDTVKKQSNDPRSPMRKLLDLILEMRDVDLENCLHVYQEMMEFKDPTTFTREEEYSICKKALTEIHGKTESRYRQEKDQFWSERDQLQKKVDELCVKVEAFEKKENHSQAQAPLGEKIDKIKQETREKNSFGEIEKESKVNEDIGKFQRQLESEQETDKKLGEDIENLEGQFNSKQENLDEKIEIEKKLREDIEKLQREYNEIYNNEWTAALEDLAERINSKEEAIAILLDCMQAAYIFCKDAASYQMENIKKSLTNLSIRSRNVPSTMCTIEPQTEKMLEKIRKSQKISSDLLFEEFQYTSDFKAVFKEVPEYTRSCLELCWLMHMQNPPVALGHPPAEGSPFDGNIYKEYTETGITVHYVVWLPLLLQENGPLLQKGVAQPYPSKDTSIRQRSTKVADIIKKYNYQAGERVHQTTSDPLVDQIFDNQRRNVTTGQTRTNRVIPISADRGRYGDRHRSASLSYQQNLTTTPTQSSGFLPSLRSSMISGDHSEIVYHYTETYSIDYTPGSSDA